MFDDFNAFVPGRRSRQEGKAQQSLSGLAFAVKDLIKVRGEIASCGNPDWHRTHKPAARNAPVIEKLLQNGATLVGNTITDELAFSLEGANVHYGTPINPRCPDRLPGGSSSGSAVAVAAASVDFALGTDTGGSIRVPAGFCGVRGFRPSHGRLPLDGVMPFAPSFDTVGWFAGKGTVLARVGRALLGDRSHVPPKLLLARDAFAWADQSVADALFDVAARLGLAGEIDLYGGEETTWLETYRMLQGAEIWSSFGPWIETTRPRFSEAIARRFADAASITAEEVAAHTPVRRGIATRLDRILTPGTGIVLPTAPCISPLKSASGAEIGEFYRRALTLACPAGHAGLPQVTLPLAMAAGCPVGLSVIGARGEDEALLALAERTVH